MSEPAVVEGQPREGPGRTIIRNAAFITFGSVVLKALNFAFGVYIVRRLGDDRFGRYSIALAFVGLFQIFAELGMSQYVMREIAQDHSKARQLFWNLVAVRCLLAVLGIIGITLGAVAVGYSPDLVLGIFVATCGFLLSAFSVPLEVLLTAYERLDYVTGLTVLGQLAFVIFGSVFLLSGWGFISLIVASLIGIPLRIGLAAWAIRRQDMMTFSPQIDPRQWPKLIRAGLPFGIISLTLTIAFSIDTVMLSWYVPERVVGWYNVAYNLIRSLLFFFGGFSVAIVPSLSRTYVGDSAQVERWYYRSVRFIAISSLPIAVGGMLLAFPLIRFLYTQEFLPAALGLQILIWDIPFLMFASFCGNMTTIVSEERAAARIYTINAVANVILNLYAIPRFGLVGAALVTVITDLVGALQFHLLLRRKLHLPSVTSVLVRALAAAAVMGIVVKLAGELNLFLLIGLGAVVYGGLALLLRLVDNSEWAMIHRLLRSAADVVRLRKPAR